MTGLVLIRVLSRGQRNCPCYFGGEERGTDVPLNCCTIPPASQPSTSARTPDQDVQSPSRWAWLALAGKLDHSLALLPCRPHASDPPLTLTHPYPRPPYCYLLFTLTKQEDLQRAAHPSPARTHRCHHHDYPPKRRNCSSCLGPASSSLSPTPTNKHLLPEQTA